MSKIYRYSASEKRSILQELKIGEKMLKEVARKYDVGKTTLVRGKELGRAMHCLSNPLGKR